MQLTEQIKTLIDFQIDIVIDMIVAEYGSGDKPFTRDGFENLRQLSQKHGKKVVEPKKKTPVKLDVLDVYNEFCSARVWGSVKDGTAGLPTNQCKKKASNGCFCAMHFKKNAEQSPWHLGLVTEEPPETDHKGKVIKWIGRVQTKKKVKPGVSKEPKLKSECRVEKNNSNIMSSQEREDIMLELFGSDIDSDSYKDTQDTAVIDETETYVFNGIEYQFDQENNVYKQNTNGVYDKVGILVDGELVRD